MFTAILATLLGSTGVQTAVWATGKPLWQDDLQYAPLNQRDQHALALWKSFKSLARHLLAANHDWRRCRCVQALLQNVWGQTRFPSQKIECQTIAWTMQTILMGARLHTPTAR